MMWYVIRRGLRYAMHAPVLLPQDISGDRIIIGMKSSNYSIGYN